MLRNLLANLGALLLLNTLALCGTLQADTVPGNFTQINMQDGGYLTGIVQHQSGRLFARTDGGGLYSSDSQGNFWTYVSSNMVTSAGLCVAGVAVPQSAISSSNLVLQACGYGDAPTDPGRGVWKSTDGGATWTQTLSGVNFSGGDNEREGGECIIFNPTNDSEVWVGSRQTGTWLSEDAGSTWSQLSGAPSMISASMYISPAHPGQIFAGGDGGLWVSTNHGVNWAQLNTYSLVYRVTSGADGTVYFSGANGSAQLVQSITSPNWGNPATYVSSNLLAAYQSAVGNSGLSLITAAVLNDGRLVVSDNDSTTAISSNEGASFTKLNMSQYAPGIPIPQWANQTTFEWHPTSLIQDVLNTNIWYGGAGYGPLCTTNSGTNWQYIPNGIGEVVTFKVCFHPTDSNRLYIPCMDLGGAIVTDGGFSGNTVSMLHQDFTQDVVQVSHCALSCYTNGYNRVIFPGGTELSSQQGRIYETTNDGTSWFYPACAGLPITNNNSQIVSAIDSLDNPDDFLVVVGGPSGTNLGGVYRTTDAGASFTQCNWFTDNASNSSYSLGNQSYWFVYLDRDATNANVRYLYGHVTFPGTPPVNTGGGVFISYDRGVDWTQLTGIRGAVIDGDYSDWIGSMCSDHGLSGSLWVALQTSGPGRKGLAHSYNGGTNFYAVPGFTNAWAVAALNGQVAVYGETVNDAYNKIYYSPNNGTNWSEITRTNYRFGNTLALSFDPYRPGRIFIGTGERSIGIFNPSNLPPPLPVIVQQPLSQPVPLGSNPALIVAAAGTGPFYYNWQFNSTNLNLANQGPSFTLANFASSNAGNYDVVVSNVSGSVTSSVAVLSVASLPGATISTSNQTAVPGGTVTLNSSTSGTGPYLYLWEFNGTVMPDIIITVAGNGQSGESGDGGMATNAMLYAGNVAMGASGAFYIADSANYCVRKVDASGLISTVAGNGTPGFSGDGGAATNAQFSNPVSVAADPWGNLYICDQDNERVRKVDTNGVITTIAGNGLIGYWGDGQNATNADLSSPAGLATDASGNLYIADQGNSVIREVFTNCVIATAAGSWTNGYAGDGGLANYALLSSPTAVSVDAAGNLFIADAGNRRIRKVSASGIITTVAGSGYAGYYGDGGPATSAFMETPVSVGADPFGNIYIADGTEHVRKVNNKGIISTIAGNAGLGYSGDGGPATNAMLSQVYGLALDSSGNLLVADTGNNRVRKICAYGPELALSNFSFAQSGQYELVLSNAFGVTTTAVVSVSAALPPLAAALSNGTSVQIQFSGAPGSNYVLETTTNLVSPANWRPLATNAAGVGGVGTFTDTSVSSNQARFYRLTLP